MKLIVTMLAAGFALLSSQIFAEDVYVGVQGLKQGNFVGDFGNQSPPKGFETKIHAIGFAQEVVVPTDVRTGMATTTRQYGPIRITKPVGASSPQFFQALTTGEMLKAVTLDFVAPDASGRSVLVYQIALEDAIVTRIAQRIDNAASQTGNRYLEEISLTFRSITVASPLSRRTARDEWKMR